MVLAVPVPAQEVPGNYETSALWNAQVYNGITYALNVPIAVMYQTAGQSTLTGTANAILLDSESLDTYGGHSTTTNTSRYTPAVPGYYAVFGVIAWVGNATGYRELMIAKNGSTTAVPAGCAIVPAVSVTTTVSHFAVVQCNGTTDYIEIYGQQSAGTLSTAVTATNQQSGMTVWWLHA